MTHDRDIMAQRTSQMQQLKAAAEDAVALSDDIKIRKVTSSLSASLSLSLSLPLPLSPSLSLPLYLSLSLSLSLFLSLSLCVSLSLALCVRPETLYLCLPP